MHTKNKHQDDYNFKKLIKVCPELAPFVFTNQYNIETIDFANPKGVKLLNFALLKSFYGISYWDIPENFLCPPIPGRADYIHHIAEVLSFKKKLRVLDIGVGANCIYPIIGNHEYQWSFVGSDIDKGALANAQKIIDANPGLNKSIELRFQKNKKQRFIGIINATEEFDLTICNPPFHSSLEEANASNLRKFSNLNKEEKPKNVVANFGGQRNELWSTGGEAGFIVKMIEESQHFQDQVTYFSTLVSKKANLKVIYRTLKKVQANVQTIEMTQGHKVSRIVVWNFGADKDT